jgi:hypothetical protein
VGLTIAGLFRVISSLTASQGFVFSLIQTRRMSNARTFQVEQQMVAGRDSTGRLLGYRCLDNYPTAGIRSGCAQRRRAQG